MTSDFKTIQEIVYKAYREMPRPQWNFLVGGSESETTLLRNRQAIDEMAFRPRILREVTGIDTSTTLLGRKLKVPVVLAPIGGLETLCPDGSMISKEIAKESGIVYFMSSVGGSELETVAGKDADNLVFQLYLQGDKAWTKDYLQRAAKVGCCALCLTVDTTYYSRRERDLVDRYYPLGRETGERPGFRYQATVTWDTVDWICKNCDIPIILKGIGTAEDARIAIEHGIQVIYVSNHGGRQLDHSRGALEILPEVVDAVDGQAEVIIDGGFVRGTDILKAFALGAHAVGLGKLYVWALAAGGATALKRMLDLLELEIMINMGLLGVTALDQLDGSYLCPARPVKFPGDFSPFPTIEKLISSETDDFNLPG